MAEQIKRNISFEPIDKDAGDSYQVLRFVVEPPVLVHDPDFLDKAVKKAAFKGESDYTYWIGDFPMIEKVNLTHSDEQSTHGTAEVHRHSDETKLHELIETAFSKALNPVGRAALNFDFEAAFPETIAE
jgi:hypothetical protein